MSNNQISNETALIIHKKFLLYHSLLRPPVTVFDRVFAHTIGVEAVLIEAKVQLNAVQSQRCRAENDLICMSTT